MFVKAAAGGTYVTKASGGDVISCEIFFDGLGKGDENRARPHPSIGWRSRDGSELTGKVLCLAGWRGDGLCEGNGGSYSGGMPS